MLADRYVSSLLLCGREENCDSGWSGFFSVIGWWMRIHFLFCNETELCGALPALCQCESRNATPVKPATNCIYTRSVPCIL